MTARPDPPQTPISPSSAPFDPQGDVLTTDRLDAYMDEGRPMLNNYTRHAKIGGGQHGEVYLCYKINPRLLQGHPDRRIPVAMKSVKRENPRAEQFKRLKQQRLPTSGHTPLADKLNTTEAKIRKEIAIMKKCRHPHVVRLYEVIDDRMKDKIYMVMEYLAGGEVKWRNEQEEPILSVEQTRRIIRDAILGLEYLHHQGIIHRDIKPANLLWTDDRRQVKIADFGVSHFSYAQRLAAAGKDGVEEDPQDPILLDDSDLTRRAGTPSFLAPEIVYEHSTKESMGSSSLSNVPTASSSAAAHVATSQSFSTLNTKRPPITKSIDIWALGVTLYCLLFGKTPFVPDPATPASEWSLYNSICNHDWTVEDYMGSDRVPTGGRHPVRDDSEGATVLCLLGDLLEKDVKRRIALEEVKSNPWFLRDLPEPEKWLKVTSPTNKIKVSVDETSDAMSSVHFRWNWGAAISRRISSIFRRSRGSHSHSDDQDGRGAVRSDPHVRVRRHESHTFEDPRGVSKPISHPKRDKGKRPAETRTLKHPSSKSLRSKSIERWPISRPGPSSASTSAIMEQTPKGRRRGSISLLMDHKSNNASSQSSPVSDKPRARFAFFLNSISHWRPNKYSPHGPSPTDTAGPSSSNASIQYRSDIGHQRIQVTRRSEEALRMHRLTHVASNGPLTADRRASSWGQGDQPLEFAEILSLNSLHELNDREMNVGAGGYSEQPFAPRTPSRLSNVATPNEPNDFDDEEREYGPACFDEDSSTIASALGNDEEWQSGGDLSDDDDDDDDEPGDDSDDQENAVTFSPRRPPQMQH